MISLTVNSLRVWMHYYKWCEALQLWMFSYWETMQNTDSPSPYEDPAYRTTTRDEILPNSVSLKTPFFTRS